MSIVRKHFEGCIPRWIRNPPKAQVNWKALVQTLGSPSSIKTVAFSNELLASGSMDGTIRLWKISSGALLKTIGGHLGRVLAVVFAAGLLALVSDDQTIKLWNPTLGALLKTVQINSSLDFRVAFSNSLLASASWSNPVNQSMGYQLWGAAANARESVNSRQRPGFLIDWVSRSVIPKHDQDMEC